MVEYLNRVILQQFKNWMLPIAIALGGLFHSTLVTLAPLTPYLIFFMLLIPYCKISLNHLRIRPLHYQLIAIQILGSLLVFAIVNHFDPLLAQGVFVCILVPTATSAAVITGMLGGSVTSLVTYTLLSNLVVALLSPIIFSFIGEHTTLPFLTSMWLVARKMIPLLLMPMVLALLMQRFTPRLHSALKRRQQISFYLWAISLTIVTGNTVAFLIRQNVTQQTHEIALAAGALVVCVAQFLIGRRLGRRYGNRIAGGQGMGQKNTILAIWMAQTYLNPITSIGPAAYVVWQNVINSYQLWSKRRRDQDHPAA